MTNVQKWMHIVGGGIPPSPPRIFNGGGDAHRVKGDAHPPLPYEHPSPPYVPVTPYEQLKFLVGNNLSPPSPPQAQYYLPAMVLVRGAMLVLLCYREEKRRSGEEELNKTDL